MGGLHLHLFGTQTAAVPLAANHDLLATVQTARRMQRLEPDRRAVHHQRPGTDLSHIATELCLPLRGHRFNTGGSDVTLCQSMPTDLHPVTRLQAGKRFQVQRTGFLAQYAKLPGSSIQTVKRANCSVNQRDAARRVLFAGSCRIHRHHLPDSQLLCRPRQPVDRHRCCGIEMHLKAIDTNAGKPCDDANNSRAAQATIDDAGAPKTRTPSHDSGATRFTVADASATQTGSTRQHRGGSASRGGTRCRIVG